MPKYWNKTVTIYNKYEDGDGLLHYYRRVLYNCFWKETNNKVTVSNVTLQSNNHIIRIPQSSDYISPIQWQKLTNKADKFTLQTGDIVIKGDVSLRLTNSKTDIALMTSWRNTNKVSQQLSLLTIIRTFQTRTIL